MLCCFVGKVSNVAILCFLCSFFGKVWNFMLLFVIFWHYLGLLGLYAVLYPVRFVIIWMGILKKKLDGNFLWEFWLWIQWDGLMTVLTLSCINLRHVLIFSFSFAMKCSKTLKTFLERLLCQQCVLEQRGHLSAILLILHSLWFLFSGRG